MIDSCHACLATWRTLTPYSDGNAWSARFQRLLGSGSLVFKSTIIQARFLEWFFKSFISSSLWASIKASKTCWCCLNLHVITIRALKLLDASSEYSGETPSNCASWIFARLLLVVVGMFLTSLLITSMGSRFGRSVEDREEQILQADRLRQGQSF